MLDNIEIFGLAQARARHAAARQAVTATNVANADTPGYRAQDIAAFERVFTRGSGSAAEAARAMQFTTFDARGAASPNGNTVSLEAEMLRSVEAQRAHSRALTVYQSALTVLRTSLGR
ncbi:FlgB family protein [Roseobacter sp. HKCCD9010]|uniref:FlgB family protein n=1 Tax=Rhodobacterales TaxID=204455 RepID=UPI00149284D8|nr:MULTISPECIES: FlgB family protein [Rhodobacterales]MBF9050991.1 FlgB family protein [Rhodobacterales bacterium HKCCD4356]NNV12760.1 FlgB family protein [Roseobacter sp. HKCCD7357]NNV16704.1 FlgB family protein [Roseobacter sp. HKCCD8768]NNV26664.1 FlgB family protein [Roseobacter sp. HKCCD8192]NNV30423.1 FlgB family protein [Roseobacter sp. HKCCD9061]